MAETTLTIEARVEGAATLAEVAQAVGGIFDIDAPYEREGDPPGVVTVRQDWYHTKARDEWQSRGQQITTLESELAEVAAWKAHLLEQRRLVDAER